METMGIALKTDTGYTTVINCYRPPDKAIDITQFDRIFVNDTTILTGDFNAKHTLWGSETEDDTGLAIEIAMDKHNYVCINNGAGTRQNYSGTMSHLDLTIVSSKLSGKSSWKVISDCTGSDHLPIHIELAQSLYSEYDTEPKFLFYKANWLDFKERCKASFTADLVTEYVNLFSQHITEAIITAAEASIKQTEPKRNGRHSTSKILPYWNDTIKDAIRARNAARNKFNRTKSQVDRDNY